MSMEVKTDEKNLQACVILVHGLARSARSMNKMANALQRTRYNVVNLDYPSRHHPIEYLAENYFPPAIRQCGNQKIHFVTHSMGGVLVRYYLSQHKLPKLGHVVMLSPPNQGSEVVDKLGELWAFEALNGPAGKQLTTKNGLPNQLGAVDYPVGVITGDKSINLILSMLIPGTDDGKVSVERAKVEGMVDFLVVPHTHPLIMRSDHVIEQTLYFLRHKMFIKEGVAND